MMSPEVRRSRKMRSRPGFGMPRTDPGHFARPYRSNLFAWPNIRRRSSVAPFAESGWRSTPRPSSAMSRRAIEIDPALGLHR
jgi:hypothetical protein